MKIQTEETGAAWLRRIKKDSVQFEVLSEFWVGKYLKRPASHFLQQRLPAESICLRHKCQLAFFGKLTNPLLPYTIRLRGLNLLFPSTNPELSGWNIAFLTGAISLFIPLQIVSLLTLTPRRAHTLLVPSLPRNINAPGIREFSASVRTREAFAKRRSFRRTR